VLIERLHLRPHPEGGYFRETYRSQERVTTARGSDRTALTSIYFVLTSESFSAFHRVFSDEAWHFYRGGSVTLELIEPAGTYAVRRIGPDGPWHTIVSAGTHFAAHMDDEDSYAFIGCDVAPGFEYADFSLSTRAMLSAAFPQFAPLIARYTR
jgi:predicted cupin superfamily sugar epimerase